MLLQRDKTERHDTRLGSVRVEVQFSEEAAVILENHTLGPSFPGEHRYYWARESIAVQKLQ